MSRILPIGLAVLGCTADPVPPPRGGLAVRLVVAPPADQGSGEDPGEDSGDDDDDPCDDEPDDEQEEEEEEEDDAIQVFAPRFSSVTVRIDELRLRLPDADDPRTIAVPVDRRFDLVGPASSEDEVVLDLASGDLRSAVVEMIARPHGGPALSATGSVCVSEGEAEVLRTVELAVAEELALATEPIRLVIGNGPDPRVKLGLRVDRWLDGLEPPEGPDPWVVDASPADLAQLVANIEGQIVTEVD